MTSCVSNCVQYISVNLSQQFFLVRSRRHFSQGLPCATRLRIFECSTSVAHVERPLLFHRCLLARPHCITGAFHEGVCTALVWKNHDAIGPPQKQASEGGELYRATLYRSGRPPAQTAPSGPKPLFADNNNVTPGWRAHRPKSENERAFLYLRKYLRTSRRCLRPYASLSSPSNVEGFYDRRRISGPLSGAHHLTARSGW